MYIGFGVLGLVAWIILATWPARVASNKGRSFTGWFIFSIFFFPLAIVLAYVLKDRHLASSETE